MAGIASGAHLLVRRMGPGEPSSSKLVSFCCEALHNCQGTGTHGMSADIIKLSDRRKVARPEPDAFELFWPSAFFFSMLLFEASRKLTIGGPVN
jgi:hypothetical protein